MSLFNLQAPFEPGGDQLKAIAIFKDVPDLEEDKQWESNQKERNTPFLSKESAKSAKSMLPRERLFSIA
jgi:hypothetical protein